MLHNLNNSNTKGNNAYINQQIKCLVECTSALDTRIDENAVDIAENDSRITALENRDYSTIQNATVNDLAVDTVSAYSADEITVDDDVTINGNLGVTNVTANTITVNGVEFTTIACNAQAALTCASSVSSGLATLQDVVDCDKQALEDYKTEMESTLACLNSETIEASSSIETPALTVTCKATITETETDTIDNRVKVYTSKIEPTVKDEEDWYRFYLPAHFQGRAKFVGVDEDDNQLFSAIFDNVYSNREGSATGDREGTGIIIHSADNIYDFYQVLRDKETDQISFITQAQITKLYYSYENFDQTSAPAYDILPNLTDGDPDYDTIETVYTAIHSDQVVVYGNPETLNGGMTVFGTFCASAIEIPQSEVTNVYVKCQIYGGYDVNTGEYATCGKCGAILTFNDGTHGDNVSWVYGCPRQIYRLGQCCCSDGDGCECSILAAESIKGCYTQFLPVECCDILFDEGSLAAYNGMTCSGNYPISELNCCTTVHGDLEVENIATIDTKIVACCLESFTDSDLNFRAKCNLAIDTVGNATVNTCGNYTENTACIKVTTADTIRECASCKLENISTKTVCADNLNEVVTCTKTVNAETIDVTGTLGISITDCCCINLTAPNVNIEEIANIKCLCLECGVCNGLQVAGDIRSKCNIISEGDLTVHGDLYVAGTTTSVTESNIATSGDYIVTRENNGCALTSTEYSGLAVNNFDGNGTVATMTADYCGEWRISDTASACSTTYTAVSNFNGNWYDGLSTTAATVTEGIMSNVTALELSNVAYNSTTGTEIVAGYYHKNGSDWYGPLSIVNNAFDVGSIVTDATDIATLEALTQYDLAYYITVTMTAIDNTCNQPILTREEASCLNNNDILVWDCANKKAVNLTRPTLNNTTLTAQIDSNTSCVTYCWKSGGSGAVCCYACMADYCTAVAIAEGCDGYIPHNALVVIADECDYVYGVNC